MRVWRLTNGEVKEGKYLVVRRDGTIPKWDHFVMAEIDPCAAAAVEAYQAKAIELGLEADYIESLGELAAQFRRKAAEHAASELKQADPDQPPHRTDNPAIIALMRGEGDLTRLCEDVDRCIACNEVLKAGDLYYDDVSGGLIYAGCCGPERESYAGAHGEPLGPDEPIPEPSVYARGK